MRHTLKKTGACLFALSILLTGCETVAERTGELQVVFASSNVTGSFYQYAVPFCDIVNQNSKGEGFKLTPISTTGTKENFDLLSVKEANVAGGPGIIAYNSFMGQGPWEETGPIDFSVAYVCYPDYVQIATRKDAKINGLSDLEGKAVSVNLKGSSADILATLIFDSLGIAVNSYYLDNTDGLSALQDGTIDAFVYAGGLNASVCMELAASRSGIKLVPFTPEEAALVSAATENIYQIKEIPANSYEGIDHDILTVGSTTSICVSNDLPEDVIYHIVKTIEEHHDELADAVRAASYSTATNTVDAWKDAPIPFHPGAERYFRELGLLE